VAPADASSRQRIALRFRAPDIAFSTTNNQKPGSETVKRRILPALLATGMLLPTLAVPCLAQNPAGKPNIVVIMGDDIGMWNIGAYHRGMMAGRTPNIDRVAKEGMLFTDYYAEASCTAGRANFITGQLPIRTGMTTVGQAGAATGLPAEAVTIATVLKSMGYATGQFGKNHLGDKNEFLPCVHGFDEYFGYLYHLDAMEDPAHPNYPKELLNVVGPRNMVHCWASSTPSAWKRWTMRSATAPSISWTRPNATANRSLSGSTRPACTSSRICPPSTKRSATRKTAGRNTKRAWPSSMTSSAR
jgi:hypothetical protein